MDRIGNLSAKKRRSRICLSGSVVRQQNELNFSTFSVKLESMNYKIMLVFRRYLEHLNCTWIKSKTFFHVI